VDELPGGFELANQFKPILDTRLADKQVDEYDLSYYSA
jgi:hypothetical protein